MALPKKKKTGNSSNSNINVIILEKNNRLFQKSSRTEKLYNVEV